MATQFLTTSRLNNIVNMITLGQQSGILRVIRGQGTSREVGQIKFLNGQPVSALLGTLTNASALSILMNWGECIYAFDEYSSTEANGLESSLESFGGSQPNAGMSSRPSGGMPSGSWPSYGSSYGAGAGYSGSYQAPATPPPSPMSSTPSSSDIFATNGYPNPNASQNSYPGYPEEYNNPSNNSGSLGNYTPSSTSNDLSRAPGQPVVRTQPNAPAPSWQLLNSIPQRTRLSEHVEQLPLDRRERMVLLLVDGRRTVTDLTRLTRRNERELLAVLHHLNALGLIQMG